MIIAARSNKENTNRKQERVNKIFMHLQTSDSPPSWSIQALVIRHLHNLFFTTFSWFDYAIAFQYHITIIISAELPQLRFPRRLCSDWAGDLTLTMKTVATKAETEDRGPEAGVTSQSSSQTLCFAEFYHFIVIFKLWQWLLWSRKSASQRTAEAGDLHSFRW